MLLQADASPINIQMCSVSFLSPYWADSYWW